MAILNDQTGGREWPNRRRTHFFRGSFTRLTYQVRRGTCLQTALLPRYSANVGIFTIFAVETLQTSPAVLISAPLWGTMIIMYHDYHYYDHYAQWWSLLWSLCTMMIIIMIIMHYDYHYYDRYAQSSLSFCICIAENLEIMVLVFLINQVYILKLWNYFADNANHDLVVNS